MLYNYSSKRVLVRMYALAWVYLSDKTFGFFWNIWLRRKTQIDLKNSAYNQMKNKHQELRFKLFPVISTKCKKS